MYTIKITVTDDEGRISTRIIKVEEKPLQEMAYSSEFVESENFEDATVDEITELIEAVLTSSIEDETGYVVPVQ